jgi:hypothetical protein
LADGARIPGFFPGLIQCRRPHAGAGQLPDVVAAGGRRQDHDVDPRGRHLLHRTVPEFAVEGYNTLAEPIFATPPIAGDVIYVRGRDHLYAIGSSSTP